MVRQEKFSKSRIRNFLLEAYDGFFPCKTGACQRFQLQLSPMLPFHRPQACKPAVRFIYGPGLFQGIIRRRSLTFFFIPDGFQGFRMLASGMRMARFPVFLIFIQDYGLLTVPARALNPHITFWPRRPSVFCSLHRRLACLQHMASIQQFIQMAIQDGRAAACALNRPVCHILAADVYAVTLEFLLHAAERERIDVFAIDGRCLKGRRNHAVTQQILRTACLHDEIRIAICRLNAAVLLYITEHKPAPP